MNKTQGFIKVVLPQYVSESLPEPLEICAMTMGFASFMKLNKSMTNPWFGKPKDLTLRKNTMQNPRSSGLPVLGCFFFDPLSWLHMDEEGLVHHRKYYISNNYRSIYSLPA